MLQALQDSLRRGLMRAGLALNAWIVALIFIQAATAFLMLAVFLSFDAAVPPARAAVATAAGALIVALLCVVAAVIIARRPRRAAPQANPSSRIDTGRMHERTAAQAAAEPGAAVSSPPPQALSDRELIVLALDETARLTQRHPMAALLASGLLGVCLGLDPRLREQLLRLLRPM